MSSHKKKKDNTILIIADKIEIFFNDDTKRILDGQSNICNWLYNKLLEICIDDYKNNNSLNLSRIFFTSKSIFFALHIPL